jgi:subtilisin family serine protease
VKATVAVTLMLMALPAALAVSSTGLAGDNPAPRHFVVGFYALPADRSTYAGEAVVGANEQLGFLLVEPKDMAQLRAHAQADSNVRYIEEDLPAVHASLVPNDALYAQYQYDMKPGATNMEAAWDKSTGSTSVKLCIVDTGQYRSHEDLSGLTYFYWKDEVNGKGSAYDDNGHGTHVTGTAAASLNNGKGVAGISPGASIGGIKVLNSQGSGTFTQVANGVTDGSNAGCHIESLSLGSATGSQALQDAVTAFINGGGFMSAAAGNDGPCTNCVEYPAKYAGVTAVACSDENNKQCGFSSEGPEVDLIAPGNNIASTWTANKAPCHRNDGNHCYVLASGTSMSTPHVGGLAALYKATHATATGSQIESALKTGAKNLGLSSDKQGAGLIQGTVV